MERREFRTPGDSPPTLNLAPGFAVLMLTTGDLGSQRLTTCKATAQVGARLPYHTHPTCEAITVAHGEAFVYVEGRRYRLRVFDCVSVPEGVAHSIENAGTVPAVMHTAFPTDTPSRGFVEDRFDVQDYDLPPEGVPESLRRFRRQDGYELSAGIWTQDLFAGRFGSKGICGGCAIFEPGAGLPCHTHEYDESITIVAGTSTCQCAGAAYQMGDFDTVCVPRGRPHRFVNSGATPMHMIWVYAGDEPDRVVVDQRLCELGY